MVGKQCGTPSWIYLSTINLEHTWTNWALYNCTGCEWLAQSHTRSVDLPSPFHLNSPPPCWKTKNLLVTGQFAANNKKFHLRLQKSARPRGCSAIHGIVCHCFQCQARGLKGVYMAFLFLYAKSWGSTADVSPSSPSYNYNRSWGLPK